MEYNQIIQGDCLEVMPNIPDKSIDMILCDLPYGTTACKWDTIIPFEPLWKQYKRMIKDNGAIVLTGSEPFSSYLRMSNIKDYKYDWIWHKDRPTNIFTIKNRPGLCYENIMVFMNKCYYYPIMEPSVLSISRPKSVGNKISSLTKKLNKIEIYGNSVAKCSENYNRKMRYPRNVIYFNKEHRKQRLHPTQKPVALFEYLIKTYTNKGDLVLDNCAGSGTTGVACKNLGRKFILIEKELKYVDIINKRIKAIPELLFDKEEKV